MSDSFTSSPGRSAPGSGYSLRDAGADHDTKSWLLPVLTRVHFYIGLFVGPFLLIAAVSGIAYALTPQIEDVIYRKALYTSSSGPALPLHEQINIAARVVDSNARLEAVRPAPMPGTTTRVMFARPELGPSESHAIFVDPVSGELLGSMNVYGTSGVLPLRSFLDRFHRGLLLGDIGRLYSELAASWLWLLAMGGLVLWLARRRRNPARPGPNGRLRGAGERLRRWHGTLGVWAFLGVLFFSVTGLTWSQYAGSNIGVLRAHYGWGTPSVATTLPEHGAATHADSEGTATPLSDEHAAHRVQTARDPRPISPRMFDQVLQVARAAGIDAGKVEIRPPAAANKAWTVTEIDRAWPTQVDAVSIDPGDLSILDQTDFDKFPLAAKLTRWGIDAHMGALFGLPNQLLLVLMATCLTTMVVWGYMMWWRRRPTRHMAPAGRPGILVLARRMPWPVRLCLVAVTVTLGIFLPVMGASLILFLLLDAWLQWRALAREGRSGGT